MGTVRGSYEDSEVKCGITKTYMSLAVTRAIKPAFIYLYPRHCKAWEVSFSATDLGGVLLVKKKVVRCAPTFGGASFR